jgi:hypothetical protein
MTAIAPSEVRKERALPDGTSLSFTDNGRSRIYRHHPADGKVTRLTSVTTILGCLEKRALYGWYEDHGARGAAKAMLAGEIDASTPEEEIVQRVRLLDLGADAAKRKAAKRGLDVHDALEVWATSGELPDPADMDPEHRPYYRGLVRALMALDPEPTVVEEITCSLTHGYAGRLDLRAVVQGSDTLIDLKTSKSGRGYPEAHLQVQGYSIAEQECGAEKPERLIVVGVGPDGEFCADECVASEEHFLAVLGAFRALTAVRSPIEAMHRAAKKAKATS